MGAEKAGRGTRLIIWQETRNRGPPVTPEGWLSQPFLLGPCNGPHELSLQGLSSEMRETRPCSEALSWSPGRGGPGEVSGDGLGPPITLCQALCHALLVGGGND